MNLAEPPTPCQPEQTNHNQPAKSPCPKPKQANPCAKSLPMQPNARGNDAAWR